MRSTILTVAALLTVALSPAFAQTTPATPSATPPSATTPAPAAAAESGKRIACRKDVTAKGLRGQDGRDQMQLCMAEGQLDCVKQAIAQKTAGAQRKDFMKTCLGRKVGGER